MANQSEMLRRLRSLYSPQPRNAFDLSYRAEVCAAYWQQLTPAQQNAVALLNRDATIWKAAWTAGSAGHQPGQPVLNGEQPTTLPT